ncbi:MAG: hypothetical protein EPO13_04460 [Actinomycetota bacterium]|nr:MAG: hypothetical protein EPO13_04460 [Actinomycetota bacterium]
MPRHAVTAVVAVLGLVVGFAVAQVSGNRTAGGVVLVLAGAWCTARWWRSCGRARALLLLATYAAAFALAHVLAGPLGAWPAVLLVAAVTGLAALAVGRPQRRTHASERVRLRTS